MDSPAASYATDPRRTPLGANIVLQLGIDHAIEARQLATLLNGDAENGRSNRETLEIIELRLQEARILAARL